jgi:hypothetical protein
MTRRHDPEEITEIAEKVRVLVEHPEIVREIAAENGCTYGDLCAAQVVSKLRDDGQLLHRMVCFACGNPYEQWHAGFDD